MRAVLLFVLAGAGFGSALSVSDYHAKADGIANDYAAIVNAQAAAASAGKCLLLPSGTYLYKTPLVIADPGSCWVGEPGTILKYGGRQTAYALIFGNLSWNHERMSLAHLVVDGNGLADNGVWIRRVIGSHIEDVRVTNVAGTAFFCSATSSVFENLTVSGFIGKGFPLATPATGISFSDPEDKRDAHPWYGGNNLLINPKVEWVSGVGIDITDAQGTVVEGGTSEDNGTGMRIVGPAFLTTVIGLDMEANRIRDLELRDTTSNSFLGNNIFGSQIALLSASRNTVSNAYIHDLQIDSASEFNHFSANQFLGAIRDAGQRQGHETTYRDNFDAVHNVRLADRVPVVPRQPDFY